MLRLKITSCTVDLIPYTFALGIDHGLIVMLERVQLARYCKWEYLSGPASVNKQVVEILIELGGAVPQTRNLIHHPRKRASEMGW